MSNYGKLILIVFGVIFTVPTSICKDKSLCYRTTVMGIDVEDSPSLYSFTLNSSPGGVLHSVSTVKIEIPTPIIRLAMLQRDVDSSEVALFNLTVKLCEFFKFVNQIHLLRNTIRNAVRNGNLSMKCPLQRGVYVLDNLHIGAHSPFLNFIYKPQRTLTVIGGMSAELSNKTLLQLTRYEVVLRFYKKACRRST